MINKQFSQKFPQLKTMSNKKSQETKINERINRIIANKHIKHYEYKDFNNIEQISRGGFSKVYRASWKNMDVVLKAFKPNIDIVVNEVNAKGVILFFVTLSLCVNMLYLIYSSKFIMKLISMNILFGSTGLQNLFQV